MLKEGDVAKRTEYADTLEKISNEGPDVFYNGSIAKKIANYVKEHGGILEYEDLRDYAAIERSSIEFTYKDKYKVYTLPPPASGAVLAQILNVVEGFDFSKEKMTGSTYHRYVEALKWGYASRTKLGDPKENEVIISNEEYLIILRISSYITLQSSQVNLLQGKFSKIYLTPVHSPLSTMELR